MLNEEILKKLETIIKNFDFTVREEAIRVDVDVPDGHSELIHMPDHKKIQLVAEDLLKTKELSQEDREFLNQVLIDNDMAIQRKLRVIDINNNSLPKKPKLNKENMKHNMDWAKRILLLNPDLNEEEKSIFEKASEDPGLASHIVELISKYEVKCMESKKIKTIKKIGFPDRHKISKENPLKKYYPQKYYANQLIITVKSFLNILKEKIHKYFNKKCEQKIMKKFTKLANELKILCNLPESICSEKKYVKKRNKITQELSSIIGYNNKMGNTLIINMMQEKLFDTYNRIKQNKEGAPIPEMDDNLDIKTRITPTEFEKFVEKLLHDKNCSL